MPGVRVASANLHHLASDKSQRHGCMFAVQARAPLKSRTGHRLPHGPTFDVEPSQVEFERVANGVGLNPATAGVPGTGDRLMLKNHSFLPDTSPEGRQRWSAGPTQASQIATGLSNAFVSSSLVPPERQLRIDRDLQSMVVFEHAPVAKLQQFSA